MSYDVYLLLIGAGIGLVSSTLGAIVQHILYIRLEERKREWQAIDKKREDLLWGVDAMTEEHIRTVRKRISDWPLQTSSIRTSPRLQLLDLIVAAWEELATINEQIRALREEVQGQEGVKRQSEPSD